MVGRAVCHLGRGVTTITSSLRQVLVLPRLRLLLLLLQLRRRRCGLRGPTQCAVGAHADMTASVVQLFCATSTKSATAGTKDDD